MNAALVAVGDELLDGRVADTNSPWIAGRLRAHGVAVSRILVSGDAVGEAARALEIGLETAGVIIVTGGIGPTADDRTREAAARIAGVPLEEDPAVWSAIRDHIERRGFTADASNRRQARFPRGAVVLPNPIGTAPGFLVELASGKRLFALPGVPSEARRMIDDEVLPRLGAAEPLHQETLCFGGVSESRLGALLEPFLAEGGDVRAGITSSRGLLRVTARAPSADRLAAALARIREAGARWFLGAGDHDLEELLVARLRATGTTLALAESVTTGLVASRLGRIPGVSEVLLEAVVAYADAAKERRLAVPRALLEAHGAVSRQCASAMARALARTTGAGLTGSVTGIAGPGGGSPAKPVGLVWFGTCLAGEVETTERRYGDLGRGAVRHRAASDLLLLLLRRMRG